MAAENNTHAVTTPNLRGPLTIGGFRSMVANQYMRQITNYLGGDERKSMKFLSAAVYVLQKSPKLLECEPGSLIQSLMSCAEFELYPSNVAGEAFIIPYKGKATFQLGYQGLVTLLTRAGISVNSQIVRENDKFEYEQGASPKLLHSIDPWAPIEKRGDWVGVYAVLTNQSGQKTIAVMSREAVMGIKSLSQAKDSAYSPWNSAQDPELWMPRKTVIKQGAKLVSKTETLQKAIARDNEEDSTLPKSTLNAEGPATGVPSHVAKDLTVEPDPEAELQQALQDKNNK